MNRFSVAFSLFFALVVVDGSRAWACEVVADPAFVNFVPQSTEAPPAVQIGELSVDLGRNYGGPGPGDCSELGTVEIALTTADSTPLDNRFGARITVVSGSLPAVFVEDFTTKDLPITGNRIQLTLVDGKSSSVAFSIIVQLVNASGDLGPASTVMSAEESSGCTATRTHRSGSSLWMLGLSFLYAVRNRSRELRR